MLLCWAGWDAQKEQCFDTVTELQCLHFRGNQPADGLLIVCISIQQRKIIFILQITHLSFKIVGQCLLECITADASVEGRHYNLLKVLQVLLHCLSLVVRLKINPSFHDICALKEMMMS